MDELSKARRKYAGEGSGEMEFMVEAWEQIVEGWRVLNWSYVYVNALPEVLSKRAVLEHFLAVARGGWIAYNAAWRTAIREFVSILQSIGCFVTRLQI